MSPTQDTHPTSLSSQNDRPILVTGAHRTGTTWIGKMLAAGGEAAYISEPLNVLHRPGVMRATVKHWYTYICPENENIYLNALQDTLAYRYHLWTEIKSLRSLKDLLRMGRDWGIFIRGHFRHQRPLLKDPFAIFSAPWFATRLGSQVVISVRHPAAFASSLKRLGWPFDFKDLLVQPLLMRDWLEPYRSKIEAMPTDDVIGQSSLLWQIIYKTVTELKQSFPELLIVRHEDLSLDPLNGFQSLYGSLGLRFSQRVEKAILKSTSSSNPQEVSKKAAHAIKLDSRANIHNWKQRLQPTEIDRVRKLTAEVAGDYYPEGEWE